MDKLGGLGFGVWGLGFGVWGLGSGGFRREFYLSLDRKVVYFYWIKLLEVWDKCERM